MDNEVLTAGADATLARANNWLRFVWQIVLSVFRHDPLAHWDRSMTMEDHLNTLVNCLTIQPGSMFFPADAWSQQALKISMLMLLYSRRAEFSRSSSRILFWYW